MFNADLYELTQSLASAFFVAMGPVRAQEELEPLPALFNLRAGYAESPGWFLVQALEFDPEPLTVTNLRVRDIYASESLVAAVLEIMASEKWLRRQGDRYFLSALGRELANERRRRVARWLSAVQPQLEKDFDRLEKGLAQIIQAGLNIGTPPGTWCLAHSRRRAPTESAPAAVQIYQYTADFNAFRDDAHMAAWKPLGVDGRTWEAFSLVHNGSAQSAAELFDQLAYRGYSLQDYTMALVDLEHKGWIDRTDGSGASQFAPTEDGNLVWEQVEHLTDDYFFRPWQQQGQAVVETLIQHMEQVRDAVQAMGS